MAKRKWTDAQRDAIGFQGGDLILSAAAGSGKTATLTERIIHLLTDPNIAASLSRMAIVTFTLSAAEELRGRIEAALTEALARDPGNRRLLRELTILPGAMIGTIHSFFLTSLRPYHASLGLPPDAGVLEGAEALLLQQEAMRETLADYFEAPPSHGEEEADFEAMADCLSSGRSEASLDAALLSLHETLLQEGYAPKDLRTWALAAPADPEAFLSSPFGAPVAQRMRRISEHYTRVFSEIMEGLAASEDTVPFLFHAQYERDTAEALGNLSTAPYSQVHAFLAAYEQPGLRLASDKQTDAYVALKTERDKNHFLKEILDLKTRFFDLPPERLAQVIRQNTAVSLAAARVLAAYDDRYTAKKRERGRVDFSDMQQLARRVFCNADGTPTPAALETGSRYDYIFIDEYQDTDRTQDAIFAAIGAGSRRFMVGDIKQSIYSFRGARPELFTEYRSRFERKDGGNAIFMQENFRSDDTILDFANRISEYMFPAGNTPFTEKDALRCGKENGTGGAPVELYLVAPPEEIATDDAEEKPKTRDDYEEEYVAEKIAALLETGKLRDGKPIRPEDIAILLRTKSRAQDYAAALSRRGIASVNNAADPYFSCSEVLLALCLLHTANNPLRDVYLAGAMQSPLLGFTLDELIGIRRGRRDALWYSVCDCAAEKTPLGEKCAAFVKTVEGWRQAARYLRADEILQQILHDTGFLHYRGDADRSNAQIRASLRLHALIRRLTGLLEKSELKAPTAAVNAVTITTIHKAKGLEFPVCFLSDTSKDFYRDDQSGPVLFAPGTGIAAELYDPGGLVRYNTPLHESNALQIEERSVQEEMRVLYVALTRAREQLYITYKSKDPQKKWEEARASAAQTPDAHLLLSVKGAGSWILAGAARNMGADCFRVSVVRPTVFDDSAAPAAAETAPAASPEQQQAWAQIFRERFAFAYPFGHLKNIPAKLTVSALQPDLLNTEEPTAISIDALLSPAEAADDGPGEMPLPEFLTGERPATAAEAGTATHIFMQFCDFEKLHALGAAAELTRLTEAAFLTREQAALVRLDEVERFRTSSLLARMCTASELYREFRFNATLPAARFTIDPILKEQLTASDTRITVQGVVDCMFIDAEGRAVLVDYKTDRLSAAEMADPALAAEKLLPRHSRQLSLYRELCADMLGRPFDEVYIYSLPLGDCIPLPEEAALPVQ